MFDTYNFSILKIPNILGQSWALGVFGRVPRSWDCPKSQNPDMCDTSFFNYQRTQRPGTVPGSWGFWQSPKVLGQSQVFGTVPKNQNPDMFDTYHFSILKDPVSRESLRLLGFLAESQGPGQVRGLWDSPKNLGSWHVWHISFFNSQRPQCPGTVPMFGFLTLAVTPSLFCIVRLGKVRNWVRIFWVRLNYVGNYVI